MIPWEEVDPRIQRIFDHGKGIEYRYRNYFKGMGILQKYDSGNSTRVVIPISKSFSINGKYDFWIKHPKYGDYIVELKSIKHEDFETLEDALPEHKVQLQIYLNAMKFKVGAVLYEDKNTQEIKVFEYEIDQEFFDQICRKAIKIASMPVCPKLEGVKDTHGQWCKCQRVSDEQANRGTVQESGAVQEESSDSQVGDQV